LKQCWLHADGVLILNSACSTLNLALQPCHATLTLTLTLALTLTPISLFLNQIIKATALGCHR